MTLQTPEPDDHKATRVRVLVGEDGDPSRRGQKKLVARSECRFKCRDEETLLRCVEDVSVSVEHLRKRPGESALWDWQNAYCEYLNDKSGYYGTVVLGVAWYDSDFFEKNKDAYLNDRHLQKYVVIGLEPSEMQVNHWKY